MTAPLASAVTPPPDPSFLHAQHETSWTPFNPAELSPSSTGTVNLIFTNASVGFTTAVSHNSDYIVTGTSTPANWLPEALEELGDACAEPWEEGYSPVSDRAKKEAARLLSELAPRVVQAPMVHSTPEGGIAIDFRNPKRDAALLLICEGSGEGVCFYDIGGRRGRARTSEVSDLMQITGWYVLDSMGMI